MPARQFGYFDPFDEESLSCPACGWVGTFTEGDREYFDAVMDSSCPSCPDAPILAVVRYPNAREWEDHKHQLSILEQEFGDLQRRRQVAFNTSRLRSVDQLPVLPHEPLTLVWGAEEGDTVILWGEAVIWREPTVWGGYGRFLEVLDLLKDRYGKDLLDLVPTPASEFDLYGDQTAAPSLVAEARKSIQLLNQPKPGGSAPKTPGI